jgi:hypothetical protein
MRLGDQQARLAEEDAARFEEDEDDIELLLLAA